MPYTSSPQVTSVSLVVFPEQHGDAWATVGLHDPHETKRLYALSVRNAIPWIPLYTTRWQVDYLAWDSEVGLG